MKRDTETEPAAGGAESRTGRETPPVSMPAACGKELPAVAHRTSGETLPSVLAALRAFRQSLALLDS